jgi:hypothetical protein
LKWAKSGNAGNDFFCSWESGEIIRRHVGSLFIVYNKVMLQFVICSASYCADDQVSPMACDPCTR